MPCPRPIPLPMLPQLALLCAPAYRMRIMDVRYHRSTMSAAGGRRGIATVTMGGAGANPVAHACARGCGGVCDTQPAASSYCDPGACLSPGKQLHVSRGGGLMTCSLCAAKTTTARAPGILYEPATERGNLPLWALCKMSILICIISPSSSLYISTSLCKPRLLRPVDRLHSRRMEE